MQDLAGWIYRHAPALRHRSRKRLATAEPCELIHALVLSLPMHESVLLILLILRLTESVCAERQILGIVSDRILHEL